MGYGRAPGTSCLKFCLLVVNSLIFIGGIILITLGTWTLVCKAFANNLLGTNLYAGSIYVLIGTGSIAVIISCIGCIGAVQEIKCLLVVYWITIFILFITMFVGGVLGYVFRGKVETTIENTMYASLRSYESERWATVAWDDTQRNLLCCGVRGLHDWQGRIPDSCCRDSVPGKSQSCQNVAQKNSTILYTDGCLDVTKRYVQAQAVVIASAGIACACVMLLGMLFSCCLYKSIKDE
ncbi:Tetraspannin [Oryctes borbonicus]|uniref:Tetraspanin n=1 Tax=Oryctes borbonicus TaxID=1629725 RepID=A0A0T6AYU4_9SCAR|nr:Tetraspannin [Oryctes borbonicus]